MKTKFYGFSKTLWINLILVVLAAIVANQAAVLEWLSQAQNKKWLALVPGIIAVVNFVLRLFTNSGISGQLPPVDKNPPAEA